MRTLVFLQVGAAIAPLLLCAVFEAVTQAGGQCCFPYWPSFAECWAATSFRWPAGFFSRGRSPGTLYALDLAGSCLGAVLFSVYLIPVFGFLKTAVLAAMVSLAPAVMAVRSAAGKTSAVKRKMSVSASCQQFLGRPAL